MDQPVKQQRVRTPVIIHVQNRDLGGIHLEAGNNDVS